MPANFYTEAAMMLGVDYHSYWIIGPEGAPVQLPVWPHPVAAVLGVGSDTKLTPKITATGTAMVQQGSAAWSLHVPMPGPPPHPIEAAQLTFLNAFSWSKARIANATVKGKGVPLACCIDGSIGWNGNCSDVPLPSNAVLSITTVMTHVSVSDAFLAAWAHALDFLFKLLWEFSGLDGLLKGLLKSLGPGVSDIARSIVKKFVEKINDNKKNIIKQVDKLREQIQKAIEHTAHSSAIVSAQ